MADLTVSGGSTLDHRIREAFTPLIGLKLSMARDTGGMKVFHFGDRRPHPMGGTAGEFALHVECPWRLVTREKIVTGSGDFSVAADDDSEGRSGADDTFVSTRDSRLLEVFGKYDPETDSFENVSPLLRVLSVDADLYGGVRIDVSGGFALQLIPTGSDRDPISETRRLFRPYGVHCVLRSGGRLLRQGERD
jgi:hypothetical protein